MKKILTVSIIGIGQRGVAYADQMLKFPQEYKIVSICDNSLSRLKERSKIYNVSKENQFFDENEFFKEKRSDVLVIATQDQDHIRHAKKALELGYDLLLEKPISPFKKDLYDLLKVHKKHPQKVLVCHVLRYSPAFEKVREIMDSKIIGDIVMIDNIENVEYRHQCHSYVRGNWRNNKETSPMIMAKCCHDLDLITWFANSRASEISSFGDLKLFKKENKPEGAASRCLECKFVDSCPFSAKLIYSNTDFWGRQFITDVRPLTEEAITDSLKNGPYGRCVFECDNNVVDHQTVMIKYENGIIGNLRMTGFTERAGRTMSIFGTKGELIMDEFNDYIEVRLFGSHEVKKWKITDLGDKNASFHNGADYRLIKEMYDIFIGKAQLKTSLELSVESHLIALAAEESRLKNGKLIKLRK